MNGHARRWVSWLRGARFSPWESAIAPWDGQGRVLRTPAAPPAPAPSFALGWKAKGAALTAAPYIEGSSGSRRPDRLLKDARGAWRVSNRLDTGEFGNRHVFGMVGTFDVEERPDLTRVIKLCGPRKRDIPLSPPHYDLPGGFVYTRIEATRLVLYGCSSETGGVKRSTLLRDMPVQRLRRVEGTAIVVSSAENAEIRLSMVDFAPVDPELSLVCRVFIAENKGNAAIKGLVIHHLPVNSRASWELTVEGHVARALDREDGTGFALLSPDFAGTGDGGLLRGTPEEGWQCMDLPLRLPDIMPAGAAVSCSVLIPIIKGGDPEESRALAAALHFDPWKTLAKTQRRWEAWSARVLLQSDNTLIAGLADSLQVLLKAHEGADGYHLGSTYQRHTHAWVRDNYLMQRGLLAAGRFEEAGVNLRGFVDCWKASGIACGYSVHTRASWIPRATGELCSYLILMARDLHLWTGSEPSYPGTWDMIQQCADTIRTNARGLVGFDGDEIWFWELDPRLFSPDGSSKGREPETLFQFSVLDNCWLAIVALSYAERLALTRGARARAEAWAEKRARIAAAVEESLWDPELGRYTSFLYPDGRRYAGLLVNGLCTPRFFGVEEVRPGSYAAGITACGRELMTPEGIVKGNSDTDLYAGLSPAFYLHALGGIGARETGDAYLEALVGALPASGGSWEYTAVDCPVTGTDKRRGGDSGVLLAALLEYVTGLRPTWDGFLLEPHLPRMCAAVILKGIRFRGEMLSIDIRKESTQVRLGRRVLGPVPHGSALEWSAASAAARVSAPGRAEH